MDVWRKVLDVGLRGFVKTGDLHVTWPDTTQSVFGDGSGEMISLAFNNPAVIRRLITNPDMALGEGYMSGDLSIANDDLDGFFQLILRNRTMGGSSIFHSSRAIRQFIRAILLRNPVGKAQNNVAHHYDLSANLYDMFLDDDRQYSCAYFTDPDMSLEDAQIAKKMHIARKLRLEPGMRVLDIGCGWGGMALTLAQEFGVHVTGVTLSQEQHAYALKRVQDAGLTDQIDIRLQDYRKVTETFDRVVSVGMFEHVGPRNYQEFFTHLDRLLTQDGVALIHTIAFNTPPQLTSPWITKYIFPGGHIPALSEITPNYESTTLDLSDLEVWRLHYAETLKHWHDRFETKTEEAKSLYDNTFVRMWRYYLKASEHTFRSGRQVVFQMQFSRTSQTPLQTVPLTRDYMYDGANVPDTEKRASATKHAPATL